VTADDFKSQYLRGERNFSDANFDGSDLHLSRYANCDFNGSSFRGSHLYEVIFAGCNLTRTTWAGARLKRCQIIKSSLDSCSFYAATLDDLLLSESSAAGATFRHAHIEHSRFTFADLTNVELFGAVFRRSIVADSYCGGARVGENIFVDCRIPSLIQAPEINFSGPINVDWLTLSQNLDANQLEDFLLRGGSPEVFVKYSIEGARSMNTKALFSLMRSTFISYGAPDVAFAEHLRDALLRNGVRTFLFASDAVPGEPLHRVMRQGVDNYDRVILICSEASLDRRGVQNELELALAKEARDGGAAYLIPVVLDDYLFRWKPARSDLAQALRERVVADFRRARSDAEAFAAGVSRLLKALRV
jgi:uncharacterized protein YjbI with pentapeptide repeats